MKLTLLLIPLLFFMTSCSIDWSDQKDAKITELEKQVQELKEKNDDELFKRNKECSVYLKKMEESSVGNGPDRTVSVSEIYYSKKMNSCIFVEEILFSGESNMVVCYRINNALTNERIIDPSCVFKESIDSDWSKQLTKDFNTVLKELKEGNF